MDYLIHSIEEVDSFFVKEPYNISNPFFGGTINLPKTEKVIIDAWQTYEIVYSSIEDYEKLHINHSQFDKNNRNHYQELRISYLETNLNISDFQDDIKQIIVLEKKIFERDLDKKLLSLSTELQIRHEVKLSLEEIEKSLKSLENIQSNKFQKVIVDIYLDSYKNTLNYLIDKYKAYIPDIKSNENLSDYIIHNKISNLLSLEEELIIRNFIYKTGNLLKWNKEKVKLVNFCRLLEHNQYLIKDTTKTIRFFEERYNIKVGDQAKPSKFNGSIAQIQVDFFFLKF